MIFVPRAGPTPSLKPRPPIVKVHPFLPVKVVDMAREKRLIKWIAHIRELFCACCRSTRNYRWYPLEFKLNLPKNNRIRANLTTTPPPPAYGPGPDPVPHAPTPTSCPSKGCLNVNVTVNCAHSGRAHKIAKF